MDLGTQPIIKERQPFTYAPISLVEADQGQGKSNTIVARVVDATYAKMTSIKLFKDGKEFYEVKASPVLNERGKPIIGLATVYFPNKEPYEIEVPDEACVIAESVKVFANFKLYGIRYVYCDLATILENLNTDLLLDAWVLIDEAYIGGDARNSMNLLNQILTKFGMQIRKRHIHLMVCYPMGKMADLRYRLANTEHIMPNFNPKTNEITLTVKKKGQKMRTLPPYYAPLYWRYFDTDERFRIPEKQIGKALAEAY